MLYQHVILSLLLSAPTVQGNAFLNVLLGRAACNADDCARAVTGTVVNAKPASSIRRSDCVSFFSVTITPVVTSTVTSYTETVTKVSTSVSTSTSKTTVTTTVTDEPVEFLKRQAVVTAITRYATAVPTYATACSGTSRYSSACSCFGGARGTTTTTASTTTVTVTAILTTSTTTTTVASTTETATATTTITPRTCYVDSEDEFQCPSGGYNADAGCICQGYGGAVDSGVCIEEEQPCGMPCITDGDCNLGQLCFSGTGCYGGAGTCLSYNTCNQPRNLDCRKNKRHGLFGLDKRC